MNWDSPITVDQCGDDGLEITLTHGGVAALSIILRPDQFAALVDQAEDLRPMAEYRRRRSVEAAKEAASHAERGVA